MPCFRTGLIETQGAQTPPVVATEHCERRFIRKLGEVGVVVRKKKTKKKFVRAVLLIVRGSTFRRRTGIVLSP